MGFLSFGPGTATGGTGPGLVEECLPRDAERRPISDTPALFRDIRHARDLETERTEGSLSRQTEIEASGAFQSMSGQSDTLILFESLIGTLAVANTVTTILKWRLRSVKAKPMLANLTARIKGWWVVLPLAGAAILAGRGAVIVLFAVVSLFGLREFITVTRTRGTDYGALVLSFFVVLPLQYVLVWYRQYGIFAILIPVYAFLICPIAAVLAADTKDFLARASETQWGL